MSKEVDERVYREFQEEYQRFILDHEVLVEKKMMPMDAADRKRSMEFNVGMWVVLLLAFIGYLAMLYYKWPQTLKDSIYAWVFGLVIVGFAVWLWIARKKLRAKNEKTTFTGVITGIRGNKWKKNEMTVFQLSNTEEFRVIPKDHDKYGLGEICRIEYLGNYPDWDVATPKVVPVGKLPFARERERATASGVWRKLWEAIK